MFDIRFLLILIPACPLAASVCIATLGKRTLRDASHVPLVLGLICSCLASLALLYEVYGGAAAAVADAEKAGGKAPGYERIVRLWTWADVSQAYVQPAAASATPGTAAGTHDFRVEIVLRADPLTASMLAMVTFISTLVVIYASGYMHGDEGYWRFFAYVGLFVFSMTMLVSVSNFILLYVFWEAVGLCSYLLIGFWFQKPEAAAAGKKAFLVNRVGDFGFALGVFLLWTTYGTLDFHDTLGPGGTLQTMGVLGQARLASGAFAGGAVATAICLLLLVGACGKSAQFPLHVWLPDAMEGPTPVSALIHAATMVTAGIYMVTRCMPLFMASPTALMVVATVGMFTALLAALIALTQTDLKRILAYSTVSQLGYMFLGLGAGSLLGATAGMFHLITHAFFKALLFLGAGSVMHAMGGVIDVRRFSGLRRVMPTTHWTFLFGSLALAGVFPFAGFWSKDTILEAIAHASRTEASAAPAWYGWLYLAALFTAFLTAFYTFRAYFLTFFGPEKIPHEAGHHAHESPGAMTGPLMILAGGALGIGAFFEFSGTLSWFLAQTPSLAYLVPASHPHAVEPLEAVSRPVLMATSTAVALAGIGLASMLYLGDGLLLTRITRLATGLGLYRLSLRKFYLDEIYYALVVAPLSILAVVLAWIDRYVIDGLVDLCGWIPRGLGAVLRPMQAGVLQFYALAMLLGLLVLMGAMLM